jgi:hypothetical protein
MEKVSAICIPRMDQSITKHFIFKTFCSLKIGYIENIYEIPFYEKTAYAQKKSVATASEASSQYKRVIIRIKWNNEPNAEYMLSRFQNGKSVKVVYDMPWYWICLPNKPYISLSAINQTVEN